MTFNKPTGEGKETLEQRVKAAEEKKSQAEAAVKEAQAEAANKKGDAKPAVAITA